MTGKECLTYTGIQANYIKVDKDTFYRTIGPLNVQLHVNFCKTNDMHCYTSFSLKYPRIIIGIEVVLQEMTNGEYKRKKEYYIKKNIYEKD